MEQWELQTVGALQTRHRLAHVAWNRRLPGLAAFVLEDGSLYTVETQPAVKLHTETTNHVKTGFLSAEKP